MAKATKLPSGNWRTRVLEYVDASGKKHFKSFTAPTKKESEFLAASFYYEKKEQKNTFFDKLTLKEAFERYTDSRSAVLSPTTIRTYERIARNQFQSIIYLELKQITNEIIQRAVNEESKKLSPKTVSSAYGLLQSVLKEYRPELILRVKLPQRQKKSLYIPSDDDIKTILANTNQTTIGIAVLLASGLGLRISEVAGLRWENIKFDTNEIIVNEIIVKDKDNKKVVKKPKTTAGDRTLSVPDSIMSELKEWRLKNPHEYVTQGLTTNAIYQSFKDVLEHLGLPHFRFHDLRHYNASVMLAMGIPNRYAQERMGHATDNMLKNVYQHIMDEKKKEVNSEINEYFNVFLRKG